MAGKDEELPDLSVKQKILYKSIKKKMKRYHSQTDDSDQEDDNMPVEKQKRKKKQFGNKHGSKSVRKIEIGWIHNSTQVRTINGGGTRKIQISNDTNVEAILMEGKNLFFPNGQTIKGLKEEDCSFELYDFSHSKIKDSDTETLGHIHDRVKPSGILRFYVYTTGDKPISTDKKASDVSVSDDKNVPSKPEKSTAVQSEQDKSFTEKSETFTVLGSNEEDGNTYLVLDATESDGEPHPRNSNEPSTSLSETLPLDNDNYTHTDDEDTSAITQHPPTPPPRPPTPPPRPPTPPPQIAGTLRNIRIHRVNIEQEMIANFIDPYIMNDELKFHIIDEKGVDANGLSREAYASFWAEFIETSTKGEGERIPCIKPYIQKAEWQAVGRILCKGFVDQGVYPLKLSKAFSIAIVHGEEAVTNDVLLSSFMDYIAPMEKDVVDKALKDQIQDDEDKEDFLDLLDRMGCKSIPKACEVKPAILNIARKELIQTAKYALDAIVSTSRDYLILKLPNIQSVGGMYDAKMATNRKVMKLLQPQETGLEQDKCLGYLKQFVRGLDHTTLKRFLRHVTGADMICVDKIEVHFNKRRGIGRVPVVRTCTPLIELSTSYVSYTDLRVEFLNILAVHHPLDID